VYAQENIELNHFDQLSVGGNIKVEVLKGDHKASYTTENCDPDELLFEVRNDRLTIKFKKSYGYGKNKKAYVTLYTESLEEINTSASAKVHTDHTWDASHFEADASSASHITWHVNTTELDIESSSGAKIKITGSADELDADASSGSNIDASDVSAKKVVADASSGAKISVDPTDHLRADASSGASVRYKSKPYKTKLNKSSGGSIKKM